MAPAALSNIMNGRITKASDLLFAPVTDERLKNLETEKENIRAGMDQFSQEQAIMGLEFEKSRQLAESALKQKSLVKALMWGTAAGTIAIAAGLSFVSLPAAGLAALGGAYLAGRAYKKNEALDAVIFLEQNMKSGMDSGAKLADSFMQVSKRRLAQRDEDMYSIRCEMLRKLESAENEQAAAANGIDDDDSVLIIDEARLPRRPLQ